MSVIEGYAVVFERFEYLSNEKVKGFNVPEGYKIVEYVDKRAFDKCDIRECVLCVNHNSNEILASVRNKTLDITIDNYGLHIYADIKEDSVRNVRALIDINKKILNKMSFKAFANFERDIVRSEKIVYQKMYNVKKLVDVCICSNPVYRDTGVCETKYKNIIEPYIINTYKLIIDSKSNE